MSKMKFKIGDKVVWRSYKRLRTGTVKKIVQKDTKPLKVVPDDCSMGYAVAIKPENCWQG